jgi:pimeloyl-ACP methyl ester carboxylesterase
VPNRFVTLNNRMALSFGRLINSFRSNPSYSRITIVALFLVCFSFTGLCVTQPKHHPETASKSKSKKHEVPQHFLTIESIRLRYIEAGKGQAVVMIHGNAGGIEDFEFGVFDSLCSDYRVMAFDRPGHGASGRANGKSATVEYQAQLLHETLVGLGITSPVLVGHSWGGALALAYALKYPSETSGLVLLAPAAYPDTETNGLLRSFVKTPVIGDLGLFFGKALIGHTMLKHDLEQAFYPQQVPDDYFKIAASSWLGTKQLRAYLEDEWALNSSLKKMSKRYSEIRVPVVIVTGDDDRIVSPRENAYRLNTEITQSKLVELKNTGHEIPLTRPECVREALLSIDERGPDTVARENSRMQELVVANN